MPKAVAAERHGAGVELSRDELAGMERVCGVIADDLDALSQRMGL